MNGVATPATTKALTALTLSLDIRMNLIEVNVIAPVAALPARAAADTDVERPAGTATTASALTSVASAVVESVTPRPARIPRNRSNAR